MLSADQSINPDLPPSKDVDGVWTLNYQLANGETGIMTFTNSNLARIKEF